MPVERAADHPTFELGGNTIVSLAAPARGATEAALYRVDLPEGGGLPRHHHDHLDVFTVGSGGRHLLPGRRDDGAGGRRLDGRADREWHHFEAGAGGASIVVTMLPGTKLIREDGSEIVPPWVS